eukprot:scaffold6879_cov202-Pinguiococcus_pyrenoidosus.AAC.2
MQCRHLGSVRKSDGQEEEKEERRGAIEVMFLALSEVEALTGFGCLSCACKTRWSLSGCGSGTSKVRLSILWPASPHTQAAAVIRLTVPASRPVPCGDSFLVAPADRVPDVKLEEARSDHEAEGIGSRLGSSWRCIVAGEDAGG